MSTSPMNALSYIEAYGDTDLITTAELENIEEISPTDLTKERLTQTLYLLSNIDYIKGDFTTMGLAFIPYTYGVSKVSLKGIHFPLDIISRESLIKRNKELLRKHPNIRTNLDLCTGYMYPSTDIALSLASHTAKITRQQFAEFHRKIGITYIKSRSGLFNVEPPVETIANDSFPLTIVQISQKLCAG